MEAVTEFLESIFCIEALSVISKFDKHILGLRPQTEILPNDTRKVTFNFIRTWVLEDKQKLKRPMAKCNKTGKCRSQMKPMDKAVIDTLIDRVVLNC